MALTTTDKKEIETMIRKEIKDFIGSNTMKQYEDKLLTILSREISRGKVQGDVKDVVIKVTLEQKEVKTGGKRNKRKTRSKRSARKSHKSRRVFGGKRK